MIPEIQEARKLMRDVEFDLQALRMHKDNVVEGKSFNRRRVQFLLNQVVLKHRRIKALLGDSPPLPDNIMSFIH